MKNWKFIKACLLGTLVSCICFSPVMADDDPWITYEGGEGQGAGKHIVLLSGDQEYRSEEGVPQLGKILAKRHGFTCTVLFPIDPETGAIDPSNQTNLPGTEILQEADLMIIASRFLSLPEDQMEPIDAYINAGKPVIGLRTATHAFRSSVDEKPYYRYHHYSFDYDGSEWPGGFGRQVLGETWVSHHGEAHEEATRGRLAPNARTHPILNGVNDGSIFVPTDTYSVTLPLPGDSQVLMLGEVVAGMNRDDPAVEGEKNDPMMPVAWTRTYLAPHGKTGQAFTTTMGSARDLLDENLRRLIVNASYHLLEIGVPVKADVDTVGSYNPSPRGFDEFEENQMPSDYKMK